MERYVDDNKICEEVENNRSEICKVAEDLFECFEQDDFFVLISVLQVIFDITLSQNALLRYRKIQAVSVANACALTFPTLQFSQIGDSICAHNSSRIDLQKSVASGSYYGSSEEIYDSVILTCETKSSGTRNAREYATYKTWFGMNLTFLQVCKKSLECYICELYHRRTCPLCDYDTSSELCILKWHEIIDETKLTISDRDQAIDWIRLRWHRSKTDRKCLVCEHGFGLVLVESIREVIHIV